MRSDVEILVLAEEILASPEYARWHAEPSTATRMLDSLGAWLQGLQERVPEWLAGPARAFFERVWALWSELFGSGESTLQLSRGWTWLGLAFAIALLLWLLKGAVPGLRVARWRQAPHVRAAGSAGASDLVAEGEQLAASGHFLDAAHCMQLASLRLLIEGGWLELSRSDPNRTLRGRVAEAPLPTEQRSEFIALVERLEVRWFRDRREERALYDAWMALHARLARLGTLRGVAI